MNVEIDSKKINYWKSQYKEIFRVVINGRTFVYRILNIGECQEIQKHNKVQQKTEDFILNNCILYPDNFNLRDESTGVCNALVTYVLKSTKFFDLDSLDQLLKDSKLMATSLMRDDLFIWSVNIMQVFPGYTLESLRKLTPGDFFKLVYVCESMSGKKMIGPLKKKSVSDVEKPGGQTKIKHIPNKYIHDKKVEIKSASELNDISISESTKALQDHWNNIKKK